MDEDEKNVEEVSEPCCARGSSTTAAPLGRYYILYVRNYVRIAENKIANGIFQDWSKFESRPKVFL